ncbi:MAG: hypothetical protein WB609_07860 [Candidatus Cybelea sp.]
MRNFRASRLPANVVYASDYVNNVVLIYSQTGKHQSPIGQIVDGLDYPEAMAVDPAGDLYVLNGSDGDPLTVYRPGKQKPYRMLTTHSPGSLAVGADGTVYVGEICSACPDKVAVYLPGASAPSYDIDDSNIYETSGLALDSANNLYVGYIDDNFVGRIVEYPPGSHGPGTQLPLTFSRVRGITFDSAGKMVVVDTGNQVVDVLKQTKKAPYWIRTAQFPVPGDPWYAAFNAAKDRLYINQNRYNNEVDVYSYPGGKLVNSFVGIPGGDFYGVAVSPAASERSRAMQWRQGEPRALLYASDYTNGVVDVYDQAGTNQQPLRQITSDGSRPIQPFGLATDATGNLYVTTTYTLGVDIYAPGESVRSAALNDASGYPDDVVVDANGTAYVANMNFLDRTGAVTVFEGGASDPSYEITDPNFQSIYGVALDESGDLYVSYYDPTGRGRVSKFAPESLGPGTDLKLAPGSYYGLAVDRRGNLVAANFYASEIDVFRPGAHNPFQRFGKRGRPWYIAFNRAKNRLFVADYSKRNQIDEYTYPAGRLIDTIEGDPGGNFVGVATSP